MFTKKTTTKKSIKVSLCILQKKKLCSDNRRKGNLEKQELLCVWAPPAFMNNTIKQSNSFSEILQLSERLKNGTFSLLREESREIWSRGINLCLRDKDTDDRGVDHSTRVGPRIFVCSHTVKAAVSTQTKTTQHSCLSSRAVCRHQF